MESKLCYLKSAGVDGIINDLSNSLPITIPNVVPEGHAQMDAIRDGIIAIGDMTYSTMIAANHPSNPFTPSITNDEVAKANRDAKWVWDNHAWHGLPGSSAYTQLNGRPLLVIYAPGKAVWEAAYNAWPLKSTGQDYLQNFTVRNCYGGGWGWGDNEQSADGKVRYVRPSRDNPPVGNPNQPWQFHRTRDTPAQWEASLIWAKNNNNTDIVVLSAFDEALDGSFWAVADTSEVSNAQFSYAANQNPTDNHWAYYDLVVKHFGQDTLQPHDIDPHFTQFRIVNVLSNDVPRIRFHRSQDHEGNYLYELQGSHDLRFWDPVDFIEPETSVLSDVAEEFTFTANPPEGVTYRFWRVELSAAP